jgi:hypothetical protein
LTYLGFITEGKFAVVLITPSLGVPNWPVIYIINTAPSLLSSLVAPAITTPGGDGPPRFLAVDMRRRQNSTPS